MAKKRKTLAQKIKTQQHHKIVLSQKPESTKTLASDSLSRPLYSYITSPDTPRKSPAHQATTAIPNHLVSDLRKTAVVTGGIVAAQLILFYVTNVLGK